WFQAAITLTDSSGRELAYADDFSFEPDPVLCYTMPKDGEYVIEIHDSIYRGREDFVYRVTVGELPFITSISPLGGAAGSQCNVQLRGWNLSAATVAMDLRNAKPGFLPIVATSGMKVSNFMQFAVDALPEIAESEPNNAPNAALPITVPFIINGRIDPPGDTDIFRIEGRALSEIVAEIHARRLNSPLDSALKLTDISGRQVAFNDDHEDKGAGLTTHHADSRLTATLPRDGVYFLHVADAQHAGGPDYSYRLRVSAPRPDFALRVVPSSISGRAGTKVPITVHAIREDGFTGEIAIALKDAPKGFILGGGNVPAEKDQAKLMLTLPETLDEPLALELEGRANIDGNDIAHRVVPAEDMQQAFAYHHLVPSKQLIAWASGRLASSGSMKIVTTMPVKLSAGSTARVQIAAPFGETRQQMQIDPIDLPPGIHVKTIAITADGAEIEITAEAGRVAPGENGNVTLHAFATRTTNAGKSRRIPLGALPAIAFEVAAK
ncbi:MAG: peptidase, partial [Chthoniobacteraceae bacterium]